MEKLSINKLVKAGKKAILPLMAVGALNCAMAANTPKSNKTPAEKNQIVLNYNKTVEKFSEASSLAKFKNIVESDLNAMTGYDKLEADVQNEVVGLMTDSAADTLALAKIFKTKEDHTFAASGMTAEQMAAIEAASGQGGTIEAKNIVVANSLMQHYTHIGLETDSLVYFGADAAELSAIDENDGYNEYFTFNVKGKRSVRDESAAVMSTLENNLINFTAYAYNAQEQVKTGKKTNGAIGTKAANLLKQDFNSLKVLLLKKGKLNQKDYQNTVALINHAADVLPASMFGTQAMRRALIIQFAKSYSTNKLLTHLESLNYNIDNFKAGNFTKGNKREVTFNPQIGITATNKKIGTNLSFGVGLPLNKNWDLVVGSEANLYKGINGGDNAVQFLGTAEAGYTTNNGNHRFAAGLKAGVQHDNDGWSAPFGGTTSYTYKFNNKFSMVWGASDLVNVSRKTNDTMAHMSAVIRTGKVNLIFTLAGGYTHTWDKGSTMRSNSETPTPGTGTETNPTPTPGTGTETNPTPTPGTGTETNPTPTPGTGTETNPTPTPGTETTPTQPTVPYGVEDGVTPTPGAIDQGTDHPDKPISIGDY